MDWQWNRVSFVRSCVIRLICALSLLAGASPVIALEGDQFTVPPQALQDFGTRFDVMVHEEIQGVLNDANESLRKHLDALKGNPGPTWQAHHQDEITQLLDPDLIAKRIYEALGRGLPECRAELWLKREASLGEWITWQPAFAESMFSEAAKARPLLALAMSSTVQMHGVYFGTDKIGHLFQQGHDYYVVYRQAQDRDATPDEAWQAAVKLGIEQELGVYGHWWVGIYSNADLAGNAAGLLFYLNLFEPIEIDGASHPPILIIVDGQWQFNPDAGKDYLTPFFTQHLSEARNPNRYTPDVRPAVDKKVRERAQSYMAFFATDPQRESDFYQELSTFYGRPYGHSGFTELSTLVDLIETDSQSEITESK